MIDDPDIFRVATLRIDRHGGGAPIRAVEWAEELADKGDLEGVAVWRRILEAIEEIMRGREPGESIN
jgi:hypothetical protein